MTRKIIYQWIAPSKTVVARTVYDDEINIEEARQKHQAWLAFIDSKGGTCNAKTRKGTPCKRKDLYTSGRCALHGGLSTGPKTPEGKAKSALNGSKGGRPKKRTP